MQGTTNQKGFRFHKKLPAIFIIFLQDIIRHCLRFQFCRIENYASSLWGKKISIFCGFMSLIVSNMNDCVLNLSLILPLSLSVILSCFQLSLESHCRPSPLPFIYLFITFYWAGFYSCPEGKGTRGLQGPIQRCPTSPTPHSHTKDSHSTGITLPSPDFYSHGLPPGCPPSPFLTHKLLFIFIFFQIYKSWWFPLHTVVLNICKWQKWGNI